MNSLNYRNLLIYKQHRTDQTTQVQSGAVRILVLSSKPPHPKIVFSPLLADLRCSISGADLHVGGFRRLGQSPKFKRMRHNT